MTMEIECGIEDEAIEKALEKGDFQALLNMVSPNIEDRNLRDACIMAEASEISTLTTTQRLDLLGQAIFTAYRYQPYFEDYELLINHSFQLAYKQLLIRLEQNHMDSGLIEEPVGAIARLYADPDDLYTTEKHEALRISQVYFYYILSNIDDVPQVEPDDLRGYCITMGTLAVGYAHATGDFYECLSMADIIVELLEKIDTDRWSPDLRQDMRKALHLMAINAIKAARELGKDSEASGWEDFAEVLSLFLEEVGDMSTFFTERGDTLMALGKAEKALKYYKDANKIPGLNKEESKNAFRRFEFAKVMITGSFENLFNAALADVLSKNEIASLVRFYDSAVSGNADSDDLKKMMNIMDKVINWGAEKSSTRNTTRPTSPGDTSGPEHLFRVIQALSAFSSGDAKSLATYSPGIVQLSRSNSPNQLLAYLFLIQLRQSTGESIMWETLSPLALKLVEIESDLYLVILSILAVILYKMDKEELVKAAGTVGKVIERVTFDDQTKRTSISSFQQTALSMPIIDFLLVLLVKIAQYIPTESNLWLERAAQLKYFSSYRIPRQLQEAKIFKYSTELPIEDVRLIVKLNEMLTRYTLSTRGKGGGKRKPRLETQWMTLLYPIYSRYHLSYDSTQHNFSFPELIQAEVPRLPGMKGFEPFFLVIVYNNGTWQHYTAVYRLDNKQIGKYVERIRKHRPMDSHIIAMGVKLREAILPFVVESSSYPIFGVRSTGMMQNIPLAALPLVVDENTGRVTQWVGEEMVTVLLTGKNQDMELLYKPVSVNNFSLFVNTSFDDLFFCPLPGVRQEVETIKTIVKAQGSVSLDLFWETRSNRKNFLEMSGSKNPEVIHIASHAITDEKNPSNSCIILSGKDSQGNKILAAVGYHDIILMDLRRCNLVVLSTCSTHEGKSIMGEGIMGLAWAFKVAGARVVIATRWPVADQVASNFWGPFYERLLKGIPIGEAFREARLSIMTREKWRHPYYWGVFQLIV